MGYSFKRFVLDYGAGILQPNARENAIELADREATARVETTGAAVVHLLATAGSADLTLRWTAGSAEYVRDRATMAPDIAALNAGELPRELPGTLQDLNTGRSVSGVITLKTVPGIVSSEAAPTIAAQFHFTQIIEA